MYLDNSYEAVKRFDPEMAQLVEAEEERQRTTLNLIVSENYASPLAIGLEGSVLANKNAQGYPDTRMVGGCEIVNEVERIAANKLVNMLPVELQDDFAPLLSGEVEPELRPLLKCADRLSAYIKCVEERKAGSHEFLSAERQTLERIKSMGLREADYFLENFMDMLSS